MINPTISVVMSVYNAEKYIKRAIQSILNSWERGQNENANGLLRQYFPKSVSLTHVSLNEVKIAVNKLNTRPRKCLGFKTPYQVLLEHTGMDASLLAVVRLLCESKTVYYANSEGNLKSAVQHVVDAYKYLTKTGYTLELKCTL